MLSVKNSKSFNKHFIKWSGYITTIVSNSYKLIIIVRFDSRYAKELIKIMKFDESFFPTLYLFIFDY